MYEVHVYDTTTGEHEAIVGGGYIRGSVRSLSKAIDKYFAECGAQTNSYADPRASRLVESLSEQNCMGHRDFVRRALQECADEVAKLVASFELLRDAINGDRR